MQVIETAIPGVLIFEPAVYGDQRGFFIESYHQERYAAAGLAERFVQDNCSLSGRGVLRGLHYQHPDAQGKLLHVVIGEVFDVAVDIRVGSPTFGRFVGTRLSRDNHRQLYIPPGFAHGFCVVSDEALVSYKCTAYYRPQSEAGIAWNDPDIAIAWPVREPLLSAKDRALPMLAEVPRGRLPRYEGKTP